MLLKTSQVGIFQYATFHVHARVPLQGREVAPPLHSRQRRSLHGMLAALAAKPGTLREQM
jgi:hypothetical protein